MKGNWLVAQRSFIPFWVRIPKSVSRLIDSWRTQKVQYTLVIGPRFVIANGYIARWAQKKRQSRQVQKWSSTGLQEPLWRATRIRLTTLIWTHQNTHVGNVMSVTAMRDSVPSVFIGCSSPTHPLLTTEQSPGLQNESTHSDKPCYL